MAMLRRYPNFIGFAAITCILAVVLAPLIGPARSLLVGFDAGTLVFLAVTIRKAIRATPATMRDRAASIEPDAYIVNSIAFVIVGVVMTAVGIELTSGTKHAGGIPLAVGTLALAWLFANTLFTLHYAHVWYLKTKANARTGVKAGDTGGLMFPGTDATPDYWDFAYFAFVLGMTFQVSDVQITNTRIRRLALIHGLIAFAFNIAVVALSVSLVAAALGA